VLPTKADARFMALVRSEFAWLLANSFDVAFASYGNLGHGALFADGKRWLRVSWEIQEDGVFLAWGDVLQPGTFNDDPYRSPRPIVELTPGVTVHELETAGHGSLKRSIPRLSALLQERGSEALLPARR
jgi:hypothetical protein